MKRLFTFFLLVLSIFTVSKIVEASSTTVEIQVLQGTGLSAGSSFSAEVGSTVSMDTSSFRPTGSTFQFWIVDGSLRHYPEDHTFRIQSSMKLIAVYAASDEHVVIFIDSNGKIIEAGGHLAQYLAQDAKVAKPADPNKPQSTFKGWSLLGSTAEPIQGDIPNATGHAVYLATYEASTEVISLLNVVGGTITGKTDAEDFYNINDVASVTANAGNFSYWVDENNQILSKQQTYKFAMLNKDRTVTAVFDDEEAISTPIINLVVYPGLRENYVSYVGQYELVEGYDLVEFGIVYEKEGLDVYVKANNYNEETNEFLMSFTEAGKSNFRAYLKYVDADGNVFTEYNTDMTNIMPSDLIISEYVEGSSSNRYIEIYNGTGSTINLSNYKLKQHNSGATAQIYELTLSGDLEDGQVVVIANNQAELYTGQVVKTTNNVMNFNGDDSVFLTRNGETETIVDYVGVRTENFGVDKTFVRKSTVSTGVSEWNKSEWAEFEQDVHFLGSHTMIRGKSLKYDQSKIDQASLELPSFDTYYVEQTVNLPKFNENGALITWAFQDATDPNNTYMNLTTGLITVPEIGVKTVKIKAIIQIGSTTSEKDIQFNVQGRLTIDEVRSKTVGTAVSFKGIVTGFYGKTVFIEDASGAIQLYYETALDSNIGVGNEVIIQGTVGVYYGMIQVSNITATTFVSSDNTLSTPVDIDGILTITADYQARRINLIGLTVKEKTAATLTLTDGTNELKIVATATDVIDKLSSATINEVVNINGMHVEWDSSGRKLRALHVDEITLLGVPDTYYAQEAIDSLIVPATVTDSLILDTTHENGSTITWTSNHEAITIGDPHSVTINRPTDANVDVTLIATVTKGTATLTKEFTVTVIKEGAAEPEPEMVVLGQSDFGETNGWGAYTLRTDQDIENGSEDPAPNGKAKWDVLGGNVNNADWSYIRMGGKSESSLDNPNAYLRTKYSFNSAVTKIVIQIAALDGAKGDEKIHLQTSPDGTNWTTVTNKTTIVGDLIFDELDVASNTYFRFVFERASSGTNNKGTDVVLITFYGFQ